MRGVVDSDDVGRALLADKHRAQEEFTRQLWRLLGWSTFLYALLQGTHFNKQGIRANNELSKIGGDPDVEAPSLHWEPSAGTRAGMKTS